jgi:hypothetical protein
MLGYTLYSSLNVTLEMYDTMITTLTCYCCDIRYNDAILTCYFRNVRYNYGYINLLL